MNTKLKKYVYCAMFVAIAVVLSIFTIKFGDIFELNLAPVVIMLAGIMIGPVFGGVGGVAADFIGTMIIGTGYNPLFSVTWFFYGLIPGMIIKKLPASLPRSVAGISAAQIICSLCLNTLWIYLIYGPGLSLMRFVGSLCSLGIYFVIFILLQKKIGKYSLR